MQFTDPIMQRLVALYPPPDFQDRSDALYQSLIEAIISQQLSIKAAETITARFVSLFSPHTFPEPQMVLAMKDEHVRAAGLSYAKIGYIKAISQAFADKQIDLEKMKLLSDEEVIEKLIQLKGVGRWTAEMILIFSLQRLDVFSVDDNGIQRAIKNLYGVSDKQEMITLAESWKPYRSIACWYLWKSLSLPQERA